MELADGGVAGASQLAVDLDVFAADLRDRDRLGDGDHPVAPLPEVASGRPPAQRALEGVAVCVDEAGQ